MATKSILKFVHIRDQKSALRLAKALESSKSAKEPNVHYSRPVSTATKERIQKLFGDQKDGV